MDGALNHLPHIRRRDLVVSFLTLLLAFFFLSATTQHPQPALAQPFLQPPSTSKMSANPRERTYIMVKPDGVQRGLVGEIISRFEKRGYKILALKTVWIKDEKERETRFRTHYADLEKEHGQSSWYPLLIKYMSSGPVVAIVIEGINAVKTGRAMLGETNPLDSKPGTIRGDYALTKGRNICHGSDSVQNAEAEIALWFPEGVADYSLASHNWIYD